MSEKEFETLLEDYLPEEKKSGDVVEGIITRKELDYGFLDLNAKKEGRIYASEVKDFEIGDKIEVKVLREDEDNIIVSKFVLDRAKELASFNVDDIVTGEIVKKIKGGYTVRIGKNEAFLPFSLARFEKDKDYTGQKFKFIIKEKNRSNITISIKQLSEDPWIAFENSHNVGDVVEAVVKDVLDFGIVVTVDGNSGFVHVSELAWHNGSKELKNYKAGDKFSAKIIQIENEKKNVKLSVKQLSENPWNTVKEKYHIGDFNDEKNRVTLSVKALLDDKWDVLEETYDFDKSYKGKVMNVQDYGIFVELEKGIEVFIHKNEFSWDKREHKEYKVGDEVEFKVIVIDKIEKKLSGSIKQLEKSPWKEVTEKYKKGNIVNTEIVEIQENFVLVKLTDRFNGIVPKRELTEDFLKDISEKFSVGDKVEAVITDINEKRKSIALSLKKVQEMEEKKEMDELMKVYGV